MQGNWREFPSVIDPGLITEHLKEICNEDGCSFMVCVICFSQAHSVEGEICWKLEHSITVVNSYECILILLGFAFFFIAACGGDTCLTHFELNSM